MKLIINKNQLETNPDQFIRRAGYARLHDRRSGQYSYARRLSSDFYPRFHLYINEESDKVIFNLHLDQKRPGYAGQNRHNAEYDGELVEEEIKRLRSLLLPSFMNI